MSAYDELRKALPYAEAWGAASRSLAFRRIAELLIRARGTKDIELRAQALATLERLRPQVSAEARRDVVRLATEHWPDPSMLWLSRHEPPESLAELAARARLHPADWEALAAELPPSARAAIAAQIDPAPPPPIHPAVEDGAQRIDELRAMIRGDAAAEAPTNAPPPEVQLAELAGDWRWECDARGVVISSEGAVPPGTVRSLLDLAEADVIWAAFARRAPFRGIDVRIGDAGWTLAGVPFFDRATGRFLGYRGAATRARSAGLFGSAASGDALAKLAHEVRSPLNAIMGFAQMIESETLGSAPEPYRRRAGAILDNAQRLLGALDDLTDAARLDRGHWPVEAQPVDVGALIERVAERFRPFALSRGVAIATTVAPGLPEGLADPQALDRAVKRLLAAVVAIAEAGEGLLLGAQRAGGVEVRLFLTRPSALDELSEAQLFETANVAREGAAAPLLGLGFGLRLVRRLLEAMGGRFEIDPQRFLLTLPPAGHGEQPVAKDDQSA